MWIPRLAKELVLRRAAQRPALLVTGARQVGKTSLIQRAFPEHRYVSLDLPSDAALADGDPAAFLARHAPPVVVDEVQYAPGLFRYIKAAIDRDRGRPGQFILSGSQALPLMRSVSESLAGRVDVLELEGLSYEEIRAARPELSAEEITLRGGFPELYENLELDASAWFRSYIATYLERDLRDVLGIGSLRTFERFLRACALRSGGVLNKAELGRDVGVSGPTADAWLSALEATGQIALLEPWQGNATKRLVKRPKLYLRDSGLCAFLAGVMPGDDLRAIPMGGALWETMVFSDLRRTQLAARGAWNAWFWRDRTAEVDFLAHRGGRFDLADAKLGRSPSRRDGDALRRVAGEVGGPVDSMLLFCPVEHAFPVADGVSATPLGTPWPPQSFLT